MSGGQPGELLANQPSEQGPDEAPGARAMAAMSHAVTAARASAPVKPDEALPPAPDEEADPDDGDLLAARFCRFDERDPRLIAALHPGGWMREGGSDPLSTLEALADAADAFQADHFAAKQARRRKRR